MPMSAQLLIADGPAPAWWESPDIWVVPGGDPNGSPGTPVAGDTASLWARVHNEGDVDVSGVAVDFWVADPSTQIRRSTAHHIGTAYADIAAGDTQDVLCLVAWQVTIVNGGHECVVVEASSPADPLQPPPADPDELDPPTYRQIAQRNLSVAIAAQERWTQLALSVAAGRRSAKTVELEATAGAELSRTQLATLGIEGHRPVGSERVSLSLTANVAADVTREHRPLRLQVAAGHAAPAYLSVAMREPLGAGEYALVRVVERDGKRALGGLSLVLISGAKQ
jgi:hypothetical protein